MHHLVFPCHHSQVILKSSIFPEGHLFSSTCLTEILRGTVKLTFQALHLAFFHVDIVIGMAIEHEKKKQINIMSNFQQKKLLQVGNIFGIFTIQLTFLPYSS